MTPKQLFYGMIGLLVLVAGGAGGVYYTVNGRLADDINEISAKLVERESIDAEARALTETKNEYEEILTTGVQDKLDLFLPDAKTQEDAIDELFDIFRRSNIPLEAISFEPTDELPGETSQSFPSPTSGVYSMNVAISVKGAITYNQFYRLLLEFEDANRHVSIHQLQLSSANVDADGVEGKFVNVNIGIYIHYQGQAAAPTVDKEALLKQLEESTGQAQ